MDKAILDRVQRQAWFHRYPRGFPIGLLLFILMITAIAVSAIEHSERANRAMRVKVQGRELAAAMQRRATETIAYLIAGKSLFEAQGRVTAETFSMYDFDRAESLQERGALAIGFAPWLRPGDVPQFVAAQGRDWPSGRSVFPKPDRLASAVTPITLIQPNTAQNRSAVGFDMYSEPVRRAAMDRARSTDRPAMTGIVHLVQDGANSRRNGFLIYVPIRRQDGSAGGPFMGFVYAAFRADEFMQSAARLVAPAGIRYALYDGAAEPANLLAGNPVERLGTPPVSVPLVLAQRHLLLVLSDTEPVGLSLLSQITVAFGIVIGGILMGTALLVTRRAAEDRRVLEWLTRQSQIRTALSRELNHRVKNTLANVLSIVSLTKRRATTIEEFSEGLIGRLRALSATQDLLVQREWTDAPVGEIIRSELAPYMQSGDNQVRLDGPDVAIAPNDALSLGLAIHELATNAAKYGALSATGGEVSVRWHVTPAEQVEVLWQESKGPRVAPPTRRGFGSDLIERIVAHELKNAVTIDFDPAGVRCTLVVPLRDRNEFMIRQQQ